MASPRRSILPQAEEKKGAEEKVSKTRGWALKRFIASVIQFLDDKKQHPTEAAPAFFELKEKAMDTDTARKNQLKRSLGYLQKLPAGSPRLMPSFIDELQKYEKDLKAKHFNRYLKSYHDFMKDFFEEKKEETQYHPINKQKVETFLGKESKARELDLHLYDIPKSLECLKAAGRLEGKEGEKNREYVLANSEPAKSLCLALDFLKRDSAATGNIYSSSDYQLLLKYPQFALDVSEIYAMLKPYDALDDNALQLLAENLQYIKPIKDRITRDFRCTVPKQYLYPGCLNNIIIILERKYDPIQQPPIFNRIRLTKEEYDKLHAAFDATSDTDLVSDFCASLEFLHREKHFEGREGKKFREAIIFKDLHDCIDNRTTGFYNLFGGRYFEGEVGAELYAFLIEKPQLAFGVYKMLDHFRLRGFLERDPRFYGHLFQHVLEGADWNRRIYQHVKDNIRYPDNMSDGYAFLDCAKSPDQEKEYFLFLLDNPQHIGQLGTALVHCHKAGMNKKKEWKIYLKLLLENQAHAICLGVCITALETQTDLFKNKSDKTRNLALLVKNAPFSTLHRAVSWLAAAGLLRGAEAQENFNTLMRYAAAHHAIYEAMQNTVPTQEGFDMIMEKLTYEHNTQRLFPLIAFVRANQSDLKYSFPPLSYTISDFIGTRDQKGLQEQAQAKKKSVPRKQR